MERVDVGVLGPLRLLVGGAPVPVERVQTRALIALLALSPGRVVGFSTLIDTLWPLDRLPQRPVDALRTIAARARAVLGDQILTTHPDGYELVLDRDRIDLHRFAALAAKTSDSDALGEALALWRGEPFADCGAVRRLTFTREHLTNQRLEIGRRRIQLLLDHGDARRAARVAGSLLTEHPYERDLPFLAAVALERLGRVADARLVLQHARRMVLDEDPGDDVSEFDRELARLEPLAAAHPVPAPRSSPPAEVPNSLAGHAIDLVGREHELTCLREAALRARTTGQVVVAIGEAGIGKTALAASFGAELGWTQRVVRCGPGSPESLADLADDDDPARAAALPDGDSAATVARGVLTTLRRLSGSGPVYLVLDDLHWASEPDVRSIRGIVRNGLPPDVLLVITVRPLSTLAPAAAALLAEVLREPTADPLELSPLTSDEVRELVQRLQPDFDDHDARRIAELTQGNAFAIEAICSAPELLDGLGDGRGAGQAAVVLATEQRLAAIPAHAVAALEHVSLLDPPLDLAAAASIDHTALVDFAERLRPAFDAHLLVEQAGTARFDHDLTRQVVQRRQPAALRRALHDRVAHHYLGRGDLVAAGRHLVQALPDSTIVDQVAVLTTAADAAGRAATRRRHRVSRAAAGRITTDPLRA
ncbi:MAG: BTAD domain-containing putative transcriptional regulator [Ilumatobacteraceae bacterium]